MSLCAIDTSLCAQFLCVKITGVKAVESPDFIQHRLKSAGISPKNLLVDVTNYICMDLGQPMHVYDADLVKGVLRATHGGGELECLDGNTITLTPTDILIADDSGPIGLAGIMGGASTAVSETTVNIILEAAVFDCVAIAKSGQNHNIVSNSRARFERGIDPAMTENAMQKALDLIVQYGGGTVASTDFKTTPLSNRTITFDPALMKERTGVELSEERMKEILERLGCVVSPSCHPRESEDPEDREAPLDSRFRGNDTTVTIPTWRHDLERPEDLVEELLRITGYDALPTMSLPPMPHKPDTYAPIDLTHLGLMECVTFSFTAHDKAKLFVSSSCHSRVSGNPSYKGQMDPRLREDDVNSQLVELGNPISQDLSTMKPSLLCGLLDTTKHNLNYGQEHCALYEVGKSYASSVETPMVAGLRCGNFTDRTWHTPIRVVDTFDAKADCLMVLQSFGVSEDKMQLTRDVPSYYHPHQSGCFQQGKKVLGYFGALHPLILKAYDIKKPCVGFEIFIDAMPARSFKVKSYTASDLQKTRLDFSFVVDANQEAAPLCQVITKMPMVQDVSVFDVYTGAGIPEGKKAVAIQFVLQPTDKTLTDADIHTLMQNITQTITIQFQAQLRG